MIFRETGVRGAWVIGIEPHDDARGWFARVFCREEFEAHGLDPDVSQCSLSYNRRRGTLRGMHYQEAPFEEAKLVRCVTGTIFDVVLDLRPDSPTYLRHEGVELSAGNRLAIYIPKGCAHGFQTLEDDTEVLYQMSDPYAPGYGCGVRWNDPAFGIRWPLEHPSMAERDATYPDYEPVR